jgi:hypothetical protein
MQRDIEGFCSTRSTSQKRRRHASEQLHRHRRADLKPLYDFTLDCQACQAKLSAAQSDLLDERSKTAALAKERDAAVRLAKGGSAWRRVTRAAKWFLLGAAAGALVAKAH